MAAFTFPLYSRVSIGMESYSDDEVGTGLKKPLPATIPTPSSDPVIPLAQSEAPKEGVNTADKGIKGSEAELARQRDLENARQTKKLKDIKAASDRLKAINEQAKAQANREALLKNQQDLALIEKAREATKKERLFSEEQAKKAHDDEIRKRLLAVSDAQIKHQEFKKEEARLTSQIAELSSLASQMMQNSAAMSSVKNSGAAPIKNPTKASQDSSSVSQQPILDKEDAKIADETQAKLDALDKDLAAEGKSTAASKKPKDYSLKKALLAKLAAGEKLSASEMKSLGNGSSTEGDASNVSAKREAPATNVTEDFLESPISQTSGGSPKFSMRGSETDAEVKRLVDGEASRGLASIDPIQADGVLETDSPSLFERVKSHISACLRQRCVASAYVAK